MEVVGSRGATGSGAAPQQRCHRRARVHPAEAQAVRRQDQEAHHRNALWPGTHLPPHRTRAACGTAWQSVLLCAVCTRVRARAPPPTGCPRARVRAPPPHPLSQHTATQKPPAASHTARPRAARDVDAHHAPSTVPPLGSEARAVDASSRGSPVSAADPASAASPARPTENKCLKFTPTFLLTTVS